MSLAAIKKSQHIHASLDAQGPTISCTHRNALWIAYIRVATLPSLILVPFAEHGTLHMQWVMCLAVFGVTQRTATVLQDRSHRNNVPVSPK